MADDRKTYVRRSRSRRIQVYITDELYKKLENEAEDEGITMSTLASRLLSNELDMDRLLREYRFTKEDLETVFLGIEILGARLDELTKFLSVRLPAQPSLSEDRKIELSAQAQRITTVMAKTAADTAMKYRTGVSDMDPLGIDQVLRNHQTQPDLHLEYSEDDEQES